MLFRWCVWKICHLYYLVCYLFLIRRLLTKQSKEDSTARKPILRATAPEFTSSSNTFLVEREGEMPENAVPQTTVESTSHTGSGRGTPFNSGSLPKPAHLSSFPPYETVDDTRTNTPEPIKVVRSKKKTTGTHKEKTKKRSANASTTTQ
jgi:AP-3 complex subunit delta